MSSIFGDKPGACERQLKRKYNNPLFGDQSISLLDIRQAQQQDAREVESFLSTFRQLVKQSVELEPNAEADVILKIKEQLDKSYEQCAGLAGDQSEIKDMLKRLIKAIMHAMWKGIGQDAQAHSKLEMEEQARAQHFQLLECSLIADLLRPDSCISEQELVPTLLSETSAAVKLAMPLFVPEQQASLCTMARQLIDKLDSTGSKLEQPRCRLSEMEAIIEPVNQLPS